MKKFIVLAMIIFLMTFGASTAPAATNDLFDWAFYVDGTTYENFNGDSMPTTGSLSPLGTLSWSTSTLGSHTFISFFDYEIDETINTYFNESGATSGTPAIGQSWEIDEPGYIFGDIYSNVLAGSLDNSNALPAGSEDDVSMAMGWNFTLAANEIATITLDLSDIAPMGGFYLTQYDPDSDASIYFSSSLQIRPTGVPEPATILLLGTGLVGLAGIKIRKFRKR